jgi:hypothetical protein
MTRLRDHGPFRGRLDPGASPSRRQAIWMMPGSTGWKRSATAGS